MSQDYKKGRKKFLKRQYEEDDKIFESLLMKELKKREEFQFVVVLQKSYETGKVEYQFNHLRLPRPLILKLQIAQQDPIWNNIKFKNYSPIKIYRKYRALVKKHQQNKDYKQVRTQYRKNIKIYQDETLYCICRRKYKEDEPMIQCETCTQWFHFFCIGYIGTSEEASKMDQYICKNCEQNDNTLNQQRRFSKYKHLFLENQRKLSDEQKERIKRIQQAFKDIKTDT